MKSLVTKLASDRLSTCGAITLIFTYTFLLGRDFECTCEPQPFQCDLYLILPFFIILLLILWIDGSFQRVCRYLCSDSAECSRETTCNFWGSFIRNFLKAALVGLLWVAFVYLDGDWYVCCENDHSEQQAPLACKAKDNITEKERVIIAELRNESRVFGSFILLGIVLVATLIPLCRKCYERKSSCCNRGFVYEKLILEEEENVLEEILRESAKDQLTKEVEDRLSGGQWEKCFDVAVEQINASARPTIKEQQKRRNDQPLQVQQEENNQHEEQEDRMPQSQSTHEKL